VIGIPVVGIASASGIAHAAGMNSGSSGIAQAVGTTVESGSAQAIGVVAEDGCGHAD
jgi:hypothetical protein